MAGCRRNNACTFAHPAIAALYFFRNRSLGTPFVLIIPTYHLPRLWIWPHFGLFRVQSRNEMHNTLPRNVHRPESEKKPYFPFTLPLVLTVTTAVYRSFQVPTYLPGASRNNSARVIGAALALTEINEIPKRMHAKRLRTGFISRVFPVWSIRNTPSLETKPSNTDIGLSAGNRAKSHCFVSLVARLCGYYVEHRRIL